MTNGSSERAVFTFRVFFDILSVHEVECLGGLDGKGHLQRLFRGGKDAGQSGKRVFA